MLGGSGDPSGRATPFAGRTAWARSLETPLREFLRTETGGAAVLLAATIAALVWVNVDASSYERLWADDALDRHRRSRRRAGSPRLGEQRADDVLLLRRRARGAPGVRPGRAAGAAAVRIAAAGRHRRHGGAVAIYLAFNAGRSSAHGWGIAMSTDTAFALGPAGARRAALSRPPAGVHAHRRRRRRRRRARRHRDRLHGHAQCRAAACGRRLLRRRSRRAQPASARRSRLCRARGCGMGGRCSSRGSSRW